MGPEYAKNDNKDIAGVLKSSSSSSSTTTLDGQKLASATNFKQAETLIPQLEEQTLIQN